MRISKHALDRFVDRASINRSHAYKILRAIRPKDVATILRVSQDARIDIGYECIAVCLKGTVVTVRKRKYK